MYYLVRYSPRIDDYTIVTANSPGEAIKAFGEFGIPHKELDVKRVSDSIGSFLVTKQKTGKELGK